MELKIPNYIRNIRSLDLEIAGQCKLSGFSKVVIEQIDNIVESLNSHIAHPFDYFFSACKREAERRGQIYDEYLVSVLYAHNDVTHNFPMLRSQFIRKPSIEFGSSKKTHSKAQESSGPSANDTNAAIKKQIADAKERQDNPMDRRGLEEFIAKHTAGLIQWDSPKAKEFADILCGAALKNKEEVSEGKSFVNPIAAWTSSILSHVEITPKEAANLQPKQPTGDFHQVVPDEVVEQEFDYSTLEEVY